MGNASRAAEALILAALLAFGAARPAAGQAAAPAGCKLVRAAEWPVRLYRDLPILEGAINGKKVGVLLDTGAYASMVTKPAAQRLGLFTRATWERVVGVGGASQVMLTTIDELNVAGSKRNYLRVRVGGEREIPGVDFILGDDFLRLFDLEFDYARGVVRLFKPVDCDKVSLAYWGGGAHQVDIERGNHIVLPVKINGREARAMLDSGAAGSAISLAFTEGLGVKPGGAEVVPAGCTAGIGAGFVRQWVGRFDSVQVGEQLVENARLRIMDYIPELNYGSNRMPEMLLGTDFLKAHRVLVSRSQRKVYFSYQGGLVFPTTPSLDCNLELRGKDAAELRAAIDGAIAANPRDTDALVLRAALRMGEGDAKAALADLDAAVQADASNAVVLARRSEARASLKDFEGALADSQAAIENGMRHAQMYYQRGWVRRSMRDYERAIQEFDRALELDPRHLASRRVRGRYSYHLGNLDAAEQDYAAIAEQSPNPYDAIWLSLIRARRGQDGAGVLEAELARSKDDAWPVPVMHHLLGRIDRQALLAKAEASDDKARKGRVCEASYYAAARLGIEGKRPEALPLLEKAAAECPLNYREYDSALMELEKGK